MSSQAKGRIVGVTLLAFIVFAVAMLWIPQGPALPPGLTLAQSSGGNRSSSGGGGGSAFPVTVTGGVSGAVPCFTSTTNEAAGTLLTANALVLGGGAGVCPSTSANFNVSGAQLNIGAVGAQGILGLVGTTSGTATITGPAAAGTSTNGITVSNVLLVPSGTVSNPGFAFSANPNNGWLLNGNGVMDMSLAGTLSYRYSSALFMYNNAFFAMGAGGVGTQDLSYSRMGPKLGGVGSGALASADAFLKSAQTLAVTTADVTCGTGGTITSCVALQTITGLSVALPLVAANWSFTCDLVVSQATAAAADQIGVQTATTGATNIEASAIAYTAAGTSTAAAITGVASTTTAQSVITFTPAATGTKLPIHLQGTIEGASASGTVLNITVLTGAAADLLTIYRGSSCYVY